MRALTITAAALLIAALNQTELAPTIKPTAPAIASHSPTARAQTEPSVRTLVKRAARAKGWTAAQWECLDRLIELRPQNAQYAGLREQIRQKQRDAVKKPEGRE